MEEFFNKSKGILGILQSLMTDEEKERSGQAADSIFETVRKTAEEESLNVRELLNAVLAVQAEVLQIAIEHTENVKETI